MTRDRTQRFEGLADAYDRHRPDYPPELFSRLMERAPRAPSLAVDVAAGTGIATRRLLEAVPADWSVAAIEPGADMRRVLSTRFQGEPRIDVLDGTAEAMAGVGAAAASVMIAATAFHWFDAPRFFGEAARVLAPGGLLGVIRNRRVSQPVLAAFDDFVLKNSPEDASEWRLTIEQEAERVRAAPGFTAFKAIEIPWTRSLDRNGLIAMYLTRSTVAAVVAAIGRERVIEAFEGIYAEHIGDASIALDYRATAAVVIRA